MKISLSVIIVLLFVVCSSEAQYEKIVKDRSLAKIQKPPSSKLWFSIKKGMTEKEVLDILGKPISGDNFEVIKKEYPKHHDNFLYSWSYGELNAMGNTGPKISNFSVRFTQGKVEYIDDHFGVKALDPSVKISVPVPLWPESEVIYSHYPRIIDLRWWASVGEGSITYEIQVDHKYMGKWSTTRSTVYKNIQSVSTTLSFTGKQPGRWRIRATNGKDKSKWSKYQMFVFTK